MVSGFALVEHMPCDDDDEPYGVPIGLPPEMWPEPMPTIEEQERRRGEAFFWGLKRARRDTPKR